MKALNRACQSGEKSRQNRSRKKVQDHPRICKLISFLTMGIYKFYAVPHGKVLVATAMGQYRKAREPGLGAILSF